MTTATIPWMPARFSLPLVPDFSSHGDWLLRLVDLAWKLPDGSPIVLDEWQRWLIRAILETYPPGHARAGELRYRQVMVSMGRQNGKSVLGAILGLYGLIREAGALVIGVASSAEQARIIYSRLLIVIRGNADLAKRFARLTDTRGIQSIDGGRYEIKPAKSAAVQGLDLTVGLADELHLMKAELWSDMVNGTAARRNGIVVGITTAGDDNSDLLKQLYDRVQDPGERYGYFIWEAPDAEVPDDDETLADYLRAANPSVACGRLDVQTVISDVRGMPDIDVIRYRLNRFVAATAVFISADMWLRNRRPEGTPFPAGLRPVFTFDRTPDWGYATITATAKAPDGVIHTEVVASLVRPSVDQLVDIAIRLNAAHRPITNAMDGYSLPSVAKELKRRGYPVYIGNQADAINSSSMLFAKIKQRTVQHAGDPLLSMQMPRAIRKNIGENFRISRNDSSVEIDAVLATALGVLVAETHREAEVQLFF